MEAQIQSAFSGDPERFLNGEIGHALSLSSDDLSVGLEVAGNLVRRGATAEALRVYAGLILCEPKNADFQTGLANCALIAEEFHLALQAASAVIALAPQDPRGYLISGQACLGIGAQSEAAEDLQDAIRLGGEAGDPVVVDLAQRLLGSINGSAVAPAVAAG